MHLVIDVPEKNFVKNLDEKSNKTYQENGQRMSPFFSAFDEQVEKISNFFNSKINNYESLFLGDLNKSAIQPNGSNLELNENPSSIQFQQLTDKNLFISTSNDQNLKEVEYSNLSYKAKNDYSSYCINSFENMQNKFNFNYANNLAQSQSPINNSINNKIDLKAYLDNFKENIKNDCVINNNQNNQNNEKNENYKYRRSDDNNYNNKFFNETAKEIYLKSNTHSNQNLYTRDKMMNKDFNNCNASDNYFYNKNNFNNNSNFLNCDLQTISDFKSHSVQDFFKYLNFNIQNDSNNNANYNRHYNYENLNNMMYSYFHNNTINSKPNDFENIEFPICFSKSNLNDFNNHLFGNANQPKISNSNTGSCNFDPKKAEFWAYSQMQPIKSRGSSENQNCPSTAPFSKLSEDIKLLGKKTKKPSEEVKGSLENKKLRMLKIKNETKIFNNLLSKANTEDVNSNQKTGIAASEADSAKPNSLEILEKRKALKNNKLVYVLKNNRMFQNPSQCSEKNSVMENRNNSVNNENESESKASIVNCNTNEDEKGNLQSNKEASTVDFVENNSQLEKKDESSNEFTKTKSKRSSKYRGVSKNGNQWQVLIMINKKKMYIGSFASEEEAAKNYDYVALKNHGSKAKTNFFYAEEQILSLLKD